MYIRRAKSPPRNRTTHYHFKEHPLLHSTKRRFASILRNLPILATTVHFDSQDVPIAHFGFTTSRSPPFWGLCPFWQNHIVLRHLLVELTVKSIVGVAFGRLYTLFNFYWPWVKTLRNHTDSCHTVTVMTIMPVTPVTTVTPVTPVTQILVTVTPSLQVTSHSCTTKQSLRTTRRSLLRRRADILPIESHPEPRPLSVNPLN
jgi:hypothetical protein